ncbi:hypothetical protein TRIP_D200013 [uncultured Paludibacter sp.]|nr:hypothetical protein TRIP_D200013 [uncultured Paludibacter sp.]
MQRGVNGKAFVTQHNQNCRASDAIDQISYSALNKLSLQEKRTADITTISEIWHLKKYSLFYK